MTHCVLSVTKLYKSTMEIYLHTCTDSTYLLHRSSRTNRRI